MLKNNGQENKTSNFLNLLGAAILSLLLLGILIYVFVLIKNSISSYKEIGNSGVAYNSKNNLKNPGKIILGSFILKTFPTELTLENCGGYKVLGYIEREPRGDEAAPNNKFFYYDGNGKEIQKNLIDFESGPIYINLLNDGIYRIFKLNKPAQKLSV